MGNVVIVCKADNHRMTVTDCSAQQLIQSQPDMYELDEVASDAFHDLETLDFLQPLPMR